MNQKQVIKTLWELGYFWCQGHPDCHEFKVVENMDIDDAPVVAALWSYQQFHYSALNYQTELLYSEPHRVTGNYGEATKAVMAAPRCPLPDFAPPPGAKFSYADADLQNAVLRMQAVGSGSWPMPCQKEGVTFSVDIRRQPDSMRERWAAIKLSVVADYARLGVKLVEVAFGQRANIRVSWENLSRVGQGVIGLAEFNNETCSDDIFCKMDPGYYPDDDQIRQLFEHELGHNMNLPHTSGGIMNPSIIDGWVGFVPSDPSVPRLTRFFGGEPIDPPPPPPPPPTGNLAYEGITVVKQNGVVIGKFQSVPVIDV